MFHGELDLLLPLYAVGVFTAFTLSQAGMVVHWLRRKGEKHTLSISVNLAGAVATGLVAVILLVTKFSEGAWLILVLTSLIYFMFYQVKRRYDSVTRQLTNDLRPVQTVKRMSVIVLVPRIHRGVLKAIEYANFLSADARAVHVVINRESTETLKSQWAEFAPNTPLIILDSPYRSLLDPILDYVDALREAKPGEMVTVVIPEAVVTKLVHKVLQENLAAQLKVALGSRQNVIVSNVRYFLD